MEIKVRVGEYKYTFTKQRDELDDIVLNFTHVLNAEKIEYAVISGYVAILFGRSRLSEDIDVLIEKIDEHQFMKLWDKLDEKFWCIITGNPKSAFDDYLASGLALRFAIKNEVIPNIEIKFPKTELEHWVIKNSIPVEIDGEKIKISNIELQIAFKLYLGSEKDIEDAKHLYEIFKESLDKVELQRLFADFKVEDVAGRYLKWKPQK